MISLITYAELVYGVAVSAHPEKEEINLANLVEDLQVTPFYSAAGMAKEVASNFGKTISLVKGTLI